MLLKQNMMIHSKLSTKGNVKYFTTYEYLNKEIKYIAERNPNKYNKYTPFFKIKIISDKSRLMKPNYYFVLPWHFKKKF